MELEFQRKANAIYHKPNANAMTRKISHFDEKGDRNIVSLLIFLGDMFLRQILKIFVRI
jgi:hypothetical protein